MKASAQDHPKMHRLARKLAIPRYAAWGLMEGLWNFAARYAIQGDVGKFPNGDIAAALAWEGDADKLVEAITESGWLDRSEEHRLVIHDWHDHAPDYLKKREKKGEFVFLSRRGDSRIIPEKNGPKKDDSLPVPENSGKFQNFPDENGLPSQAIPNQAKPSPTKPFPAETAGADAKTPERMREPEPANAGTAERGNAGNSGNDPPGANADGGKGADGGAKAFWQKIGEDLGEREKLRDAWRIKLIEWLLKRLRVDYANPDQQTLSAVAYLKGLVDWAINDADAKGKRPDSFAEEFRKLADSSAKGENPVGLFRSKVKKAFGYP